MCRGPKQKECSVTKVQLIGRSVMQFDMNVTQNVAPTNVSTYGLWSILKASNDNVYSE